MTSRPWFGRLQQAATIAAAAVALFSAPFVRPLGAQTSTASIRGFVTTKDGNAAAGTRSERCTDALRQAAAAFSVAWRDQRPACAGGR